MLFGRGLRMEKIAKFGRQILEGLKYIQSLALPYYHLHTGNVIIFNGAARLTDYENAYFGFHNRLHKKMKKIPIDPTSKLSVQLCHWLSMVMTDLVYD
jgi:hypothetical protein